MVEEMKNLRDNRIAEWEGVLKQAQGITAGYLADIEKVDKDLVARAKQMHKQVEEILSKSQSTLQQMKVVGLTKLQDQEKYLADRLEQLKEDVRKYEDKLQDADANVLLQFEESTTQSVDKPKPLETESIPIFTQGQDDTKSLECMFGTIASNHAGEDKTQESVRSSALHVLRAEAPNAKDLHSKTTTAHLPQSSGNSARSLIPNPTVQSRFDVDTGSPHIACTEQGLAWVRTYKDFSMFSSDGIIQLVNRKGSVKDTIYTDFIINDMAVTSDGELLLADYTNKCIKLVSRNKKLSSLFCTRGTPCGLCFLHNGDIVVTLSDGKVVMYSTDGQIRRTLDHIKFRCPRKVAVNQINQDIYICDEGRVIAVGDDGRLRYEYTGQGDGISFSPDDVCTDQIGHVLITDYNNQSVHILDQEGRFIQHILTSQGLSWPVTIDVDGEGYVWVWGRGWRLQRICEGGQILTVENLLHTV